ncbi:site-2 protease family protein [Candidatus Babeliales bacterium]|nr:site-2 protease family protein [Candidatus Babeliales bacterium]MCF7899647.1 site-2 protease family protein [Candidatus Babeliales bacterium]
MDSKVFLDSLKSVAIILPAFLVALSFHEFAHAFMSNLLGDDTAKKMGRLTLNPFAHLDFIGTLFLIVFRIGWAKPVQFDARNFKYPRLYSVLTALAGPFANLLLALLIFVLIKYFPISYFPEAVNKSFLQVFELTAYINVMLGVFNLLPIPPLDGSHIITALLYNKYPNVVIWLYRYSLFILIFLFLMPITRYWLIKLILLVYNFLRNLVF